MKAKLSQAAAILDTTLTGADAAFGMVSTDTRTMPEGALFVALKGEHFDAHRYLDQAQAAGAAGAVVSADAKTELATIRVDDTRLALGRLAGYWRRRCATPMVAVTGSNGKTTVKEMLAAVCGQAGSVHATQGNFNNEIGVPLTLFGLQLDHRYAVVEMGANHPGEIRYLTRLAAPQVGVITNAAAAHLEGFGSLDGVARAKGELFQHMPSDGVAVINADDPHAMLWASLAAPRRVLSFGFAPSADFSAVEHDGGWVLRLPDGEMDLDLSLPGRHNIQNALAAAAAASALGLGREAIRAGLAQVRPVSGRLQTIQAAAGYRLIDDSYNANPASLAAGVALLMEQEMEAWVVLGDMAELGPGAEALHAEAGEQLREAGVKRLFTVGVASRATARAFGKNAEHFQDKSALIHALHAALHPGVCCLVKGSRAAGMEQVVHALLHDGDKALKRAGQGG